MVLSTSPFIICAEKLSWLWSLLVLTRAHFLAGGVIMYALGVIVAHAEGASLDPLRLIWGQLGVSAIQLMTHLVNEYYDAERDALITTRTLFTGGSGVLPAGRLGKQVAVRGATVCTLLAIAVAATIGWPLHSASATGVTLVYCLGLLIGYGYSAPPLRLMTRGLGELAAAATVALLTPLAGYGAAAGRLSPSLFWLGLPLLSMSAAFMIAVELPDLEADRPTGKRNWVVRLGRDRAGILHNGLLVLSYLLLAFLSAVGCLPEPVVSLLWWTLPLALWQIGGVWLRRRRGWRHYGLLAGGGMALIGLYGLLAGLGYWL
jgi:1,4-dihydroxy-2-naphthoate octaprenyltransferase